MWNELKKTLQEPSYKTLAFALIASILIHTVFFGGLDFSLPNLTKAQHVIEARIQMPKAVEKPAEQAVEVPAPEVIPPKPEPLAPEKPTRIKKTIVTPAPIVPPIEQLPEVPQEDVAQVEAIPEPIVEPIPEPLPPQEPEPAPPVEPPPPAEPAQTEPAQKPQPVDEGLVINENAYPYVETFFDVRTEIEGTAAGKAKITFNLVEGNRYQLKFLVEPSGLAALIVPDLLQTSYGLLTKNGLQPTTYLYEVSNKKDKARTATFDWQAKTLQHMTNKGAKSEPLLEGTQDVLSFMYQFMYVAPLQKMQLNITNGKKMRAYDYDFGGEENVNSALGKLKTVHIAHTGADAEEKTELWLAIDYQHIPVKIRKTEKGGKVYELVATRIITTRPAVNE